MKKNPNLLFIFTDEQAIGTMAAYGNKQINTPNFNRLAAQSCVFDNAYVTQSVCTPSRSSLMTGLYPHNTGCTENNIPLPDNVRCFPELADFSGYRTAYHGKWHLGNEVFAQHGFDEWVSIDDMYRKYYSEDHDRNTRSSYHHFLTANGFSPDNVNDNVFSRNFACSIPEAYSKPAFLARESSRFIREHRDQPFILFINFFEPHMPYTSCRNRQYPPAEMPLPANFHHEWEAGLPTKIKALQERYRAIGHTGMPLDTEDDWRRLIANYWGLNSLVDTHLGTVLDTLAECGLEDDTIIVYTSDHGDMMGSHRLTAKCVQYEEAVKIPLLLKIPGLTKAAGHIPNPVSQIDLVPTLLETMGKEIPDGLDGFSWIDFLSGSSPLPQEDIFIEWNGANSGMGNKSVGTVTVPDCIKEILPEKDVVESVLDPVRTVITPNGWKYNLSQLGQNELYNLHDDPCEINNLYGDASLQNLTEELENKITTWACRTGDSIKNPEVPKNSSEYKYEHKI